MSYTDLHFWPDTPARYQMNLGPCDSHPLVLHFSGGGGGGGGGENNTIYTLSMWQVFNKFLETSLALKLSSETWSIV